MDMVAMNIIHATKVSICREMGISLMATSYSTIFNAGLDFTSALADAQDDMIADVDEVRKPLLASVRTPRGNYGGLRAMIETSLSEGFVTHEGAARDYDDRPANAAD